MIGIATCNYIQESKQNASSLCAVIRYVSQEKKTVDENGKRYLSGVNCVGEIAYDEFMATKSMAQDRRYVFLSVHAVVCAGRDQVL